MLKFLDRFRRRETGAPPPDWHPQLGIIAGRTLDSWIAQLAPAPAPSISIILASEERTGSEWLCQLMANTGVLGRPAEYFNPWWMRRFIPDYPDDAAAQIAIAHRVGTTPNGCVAIKLHAHQFDRISSQVSLADAFPRMRFVRLTRRNSDSAGDLAGQSAANKKLPCAHPAGRRGLVRRRGDCKRALRDRRGSREVAPVFREKRRRAARTGVRRAGSPAAEELEAHWSRRGHSCRAVANRYATRSANPARPDFRAVEGALPRKAQESRLS